MPIREGGTVGRTSRTAYPACVGRVRQGGPGATERHPRLPEGRGLRDYNDFRALLGLAFLGGLALLVVGYYVVQLVAWVV